MSQLRQRRRAASARFLMRRKPDEETPSAEEQAREWSVAVNQAVTLSKQAGKTPAGLARTFEGAGEATVDWRELLRRLWSDTIPADSSWMRPNRRHIWNGLYLPGVVREGVGEIAIAIDCSGSVNSRLLRLFEAEVCSILEGQRPQCVHVLYFDTEGTQSGDLSSRGTSSSQSRRWRRHRLWSVLRLARGAWHSTANSGLSDRPSTGRFPSPSPEYPVLWASTGNRHAPFGSVIPRHAA